MAGLSEKDLQADRYNWAAAVEEGGRVWLGVGVSGGSVEAWGRRVRNFRAKGIKDAEQMWNKLEAEQTHLRQQASP